MGQSSTSARCRPSSGTWDTIIITILLPLIINTIIVLLLLSSLLLVVVVVVAVVAVVAVVLVVVVVVVVVVVLRFSLAGSFASLKLYISTNQHLQYLIQNRYTIVYCILNNWCVWINISCGISRCDFHERVSGIVGCRLQFRSLTAT